MKVDPVYFAFANLFISLIGFVSLFTIWYQVQRKFKPKDNGYLYLALAILTWTVSPLANLLFQPPGPVNNLVAGLASTINNGLFLFAMFFFEFAPDWLPFSRSKKTWFRLVVALCGLVLMLQLGVFAGGFQDNSWYGSLPDILFSIVTLIVIGITFFNSFKGRKLLALAYFYTFVLAFVFGAQLLAVYQAWAISYPGIPQLMQLSLHLSLIVLFIASVLGWVVERSVIPDPKRMKLFFDEVKNGQLIVQVTVDEYFENVSVLFTSALYLQFLKFAIRKKCKNAGLKSREYVHAVYHQRIEDRIREYNPNYGRASNRIKNTALARWPFFFEKTYDEYELVLFPENIMISPRLIESQLEKLKLEGMSDISRKREIKFIREEFRNCAADPDKL